jgi:hypothetical protein
VAWVPYMEFKFGVRLKTFDLPGDCNRWTESHVVLDILALGVLIEMNSTLYRPIDVP